MDGIWVLIWSLTALEMSLAGIKKEGEREEVPTWIFLLSTIVCALGYLKYCVATRALVKYMQDKNYTLPSDAETATYTKWVVMRLFGVK